MEELIQALLKALRKEVSETVRETMESVLDERKTHEYPERVSVTQASEITGYSKNSLYQMHSLGKVPGAHKIGNKLMFYTKALKEWAQNGGK